MAARPAPFGIAHHTAVPSNFEPDRESEADRESEPEEGDDEESADE